MFGLKNKGEKFVGSVIFYKGKELKVVGYNKAKDMFKVELEDGSIRVVKRSKVI